MYIEKIVIENIRSISHFEMTFSTPAGWHVIIGDNGSGKTSVLQGIGNALIKQTSTYFTLSDFLKKEEKLAVCNLTFSDSYKQDFVLMQNVENNVIIASNDNIKKIFSVGYGSLRITHEDVEFPDIKPSPKSSLAYSTLLGGKTGLRVAYFWLRELYIQKIDIDNNSKEEIKIASQLLNKIKILINKGDLLSNGTKLEKIDSKGIWFADESETKLNIDSLSDGFRSILNITIDIIYRMVGYYGEQKVIDAFEEVCNLSGIILIDEIDAHLHPTWQTRIGQWFTTYFPNIQFIVTTHSPLVCRACEKGSIWRLAAPDNSSLSGEIVGIEKDRLIYGNILDAYGTEMFGENTSINPTAAAQRNRLGELYEKSFMGLIEEEEETEFEHLKSIFPTYSLKFVKK